MYKSMVRWRFRGLAVAPASHKMRHGLSPDLPGQPPVVRCVSVCLFVGLQLVCNLSELGLPLDVAGQQHQQQPGS